MYRSRSYSNLRSRARGNQRAADQQRDQTQVVLKTTLTRGGGQTYTLLDETDPDNDKNWADTGTIAINIYDVLLRCEFFQNYSNMYDQVRIDSIKVDVTPSVWTTSRDENPVPGYTIPKSLTVVTAWDRSGLDDSQFIHSANDYRERYCVIANDIETYSSAVTKHLGPGSMYNITRYLYPNTEEEKNQFVSTKTLKRQFTQAITEPYQYVCDYNEEDDPTCPNNPRSHVSVPFKPTFLLGVLSPYKPFIGPNIQFYQTPVDVIIGYNKLRPTIFTLEFEIVVTFRGLRYEKRV